MSEASTVATKMREATFAVLAFFAAVALAWMVDRHAGPQAPAMVFLVATMVVGLRVRRAFAVAHAIAGFLAYDVLFVDPRGSLSIARPLEMLAFVAFVAVALVATQQARARLELARALDAKRAEAETERLRAALLASVSHDLRSPLAAMVGAAGTLQQLGDSVSPRDRRELLDSLLDECRRLDRYVGNLLDMARLGSGAIAIDRDWIAIEDLAGAAVRRTRAIAGGKEIVLDVAPDLPLVEVHPALVEQALFNVLENGARHATARVVVTVRAEAGRMVVDVADDGPALADDERARAFAAFPPGGDSGREVAGTGLGLAICRGFIGAHGGDVAVAAEASGGTRVRMRLPLPRQPPAAPS